MGRNRARAFLDALGVFGFMDAAGNQPIGVVVRLITVSMDPQLIAASL